MSQKCIDWRIVKHILTMYTILCDVNCDVNCLSIKISCLLYKTKLLLSSFAISLHLSVSEVNSCLGFKNGRFSSAKHVHAKDTPLNPTFT